MSSETILSVEHLQTYFDTPEGTLRAVDNVSFSVNAGEVLGVVGESGCGKSITALSILGLIDPPGYIAGGHVFFMGRDLVGVPAEDLRQIRGGEISMIFQDPMSSLNPLIPVGVQLTETMQAHETLSKQQAEQRAVKLLEQTGISDPEARLNAYPHEFSGGMRQRVMIAIALACNPRLIIADEATTALDVTIQAQVLDVFKSIATEGHRAALFITHDLGIVAEMCDRVVVMYAGKIVETGTTTEIFDNPLHPYTKALLDALPERRAHGEALRTIPGMVPIPIDLPESCYFADRCPEVIKGTCDALYAPWRRQSESQHVYCHLY